MSEYTDKASSIFGASLIGRHPRLSEITWKSPPEIYQDGDAVMITYTSIVHRLLRGVVGRHLVRYIGTFDGVEYKQHPPRWARKLKHWSLPRSHLNILRIIV